MNFAKIRQKFTWNISFSDVFYHSLQVTIISAIYFVLVQAIFTQDLAFLIMDIEKYIRVNYFFLGDFLHLRKMEYLWPISTHPFLYVSHALASYLVSRKIVLSEDLNHSTIKKLFIVSSAGFLWTRLQQRLSEFHMIVLIFNYLHYVITLSIATVVCITFDKIQYPKAKIE